MKMVATAGGARSADHKPGLREWRLLAGEKPATNENASSLYPGSDERKRPVSRNLSTGKILHRRHTVKCEEKPFWHDFHACTNGLSHFPRIMDTPSILPMGAES